MEEKDKRLCFNCGKHWPHQWVARNCLGFCKRCTRSGKINHFAKYCKSKHEGKPLKELAHKGEDTTGTSFKSGEESTCSLENVNRWDRRTINHFGKVIISGAIINFLDNAMDEATFQRYGLKKKFKIKKNIQTPNETFWSGWRIKSHPSYRQLWSSHRVWSWDW